MKQVADEANVSIATVSRVINKTGFVSEDLELRVLQAMDRLNYHPSLLARNLRRQETRTIGLIIPQLDQPFFSSLAFAVERALFNQDYRTLICSSEENSEKEIAYIELMLRHQVEGVVAVPTGKHSDNLQPLLTQEIPIVLVDRNLAEITATRVFSDNFHGGYLGMQHLLELGHRQIGVISSPEYSEPMTERLRGIHKAMREYGVKQQADLFISGDLNQFEMGYTAAQKLLRRNPRPTAIFALTDVMAVGVMHAAAEANLKLPDELSVVGYDDVPIASYSIPALTTIAQPIYAMGEVATERLLAYISREIDSEETIILDNKLVVRQSTAPPRE